MALEAVELEVGACYIWACMIALTHNQELIKELEIPDGFMPSAAIAIGISDEKYTDREIEEGRISVNYI